MIPNAKYITLSSETRLTPDISNFIIQVPIEMALLEEYKYISLRKASFPKSFYQLRNGKNTLIYKEGEFEKEITFPQGNYTYESFISMLNLYFYEETRMYVFGVYAYEDSFQTQKLNFTINFIGFPGTEQDVYFNFKEGEDIQKMLGFGSYQFQNEFKIYNKTNAENPQIFISPFMCALNHEDTIYIHTPIVQQENQQYETNDVLETIFTSVVPENGNIVMTFDSNTNYRPFNFLALKPYTTNEKTYQFTTQFYFTDQDQQLIDFNGMDFQLDIVFFSDYIEHQYDYTENRQTQEQLDQLNKKIKKINGTDNMLQYGEYNKRQKDLDKQE